MSWIAEWTPELRRELGVTSRNARRRTDEQRRKCVEAWVAKKFRDPRIAALLDALWPALDWNFVLVHGDVRHPEELLDIADHGIEVIELMGVLDDLVRRNGEALRPQALLRPT